MSKCTQCNGIGRAGCPGCYGRGWISDCTAKDHWAEVGGKRYKLELDPGNRAHRFPMNRVLRDFVDAASEGKKFDLNDMAMRHGAGGYTTKELLDFYIMLGYSIGGLAELSFFKRYKIDTCEWKKPQMIASPDSESVKS